MTASSATAGQSGGAHDGPFVVVSGALTLFAIVVLVHWLRRKTKPRHMGEHRVQIEIPAQQGSSTKDPNAPISGWELNDAARSAGVAPLRAAA